MLINLIDLISNFKTFKRGMKYERYLLQFQIVLKHSDRQYHLEKIGDIYACIQSYKIWFRINAELILIFS